MCVRLSGPSLLNMCPRKLKYIFQIVGTIILFISTLFTEGNSRFNKKKRAFFFYWERAKTKNKKKPCQNDVFFFSWNCCHWILLSLFQDFNKTITYRTEPTRNIKTIWNIYNYTEKKYKFSLVVMVLLTIPQRRFVCLYFFFTFFYPFTDTDD